MILRQASKIHPKFLILVDGVYEVLGEPIKNPVTGAEHRVRIDLPHGFEYRIAEMGRRHDNNLLWAVPFSWIIIKAHYMDSLLKCILVIRE